MGHLENINMSYFEHMIQAFSYSIEAFKASIILFIHGLFPDIYVYEGSKTIHNLYVKIHSTNK
jgi:hypothetical protein